MRSRQGRRRRRPTSRVALPSPPACHAASSSRAPRSASAPRSAASITLPVAGFALLPSFLGQLQHKVDLGPISQFPLNQWYITTFVSRPRPGRGHAADGLRPQQRPGRRSDKPSQQVPSFSIISNHCVHLGCPVQANGPSGTKYIGKPRSSSTRRTARSPVDPGDPRRLRLPVPRRPVRPRGQPHRRPARARARPVRVRDRPRPPRPPQRLLGLARRRHRRAGEDLQVQGRPARASTSTGPSRWLYPIQPPHN